MAAPPAKRQRRLKLLPSDDEDAKGTKPSSERTRILPTRSSDKTQLTASSLPKSPLKKSPGSKSSSRTSPKKQGLQQSSHSPSKGNGGKKLQNSAASRPIQSFFNKKTEQQRVGGVEENPIVLEDSQRDGMKDGYISDDISDGELFHETNSFSGSLARDSKKRSISGSRPNSPPVSASVSHSSSQRFKIGPKDNKRNDSVVSKKSDVDQRPWAERYGPINLDELAVHKRKVADVKDWLEDVFDRRVKQRLLILRGPAGTGKTTTIRLLAQALNFGILEWKNPVGTDYSSGISMSAAMQFQDFIGRAGKQGSLDLSENSTKDQSYHQRDLNSLGDSTSRKIMLVEEFPNTFARSSSTVQTFRSAILAYLASNTPVSLFSNQTPQRDVSPLILVISESLLSTSSAIADSFTAHRLLGPEVLGHTGTTLIEFNKVAPSFLAKALELVIQKEARISGRRRMPGPLALKQLGEVGDVRNAIGSLEFLCARGDQGVEWSGHVSFGKSKKGNKNPTALTKMEKESLEMVTQREATLGIFHAVGKVVYNKRDEESLSDSVTTQPPSHLSHCFRLKRSIVSIDELIDETGTDIDTFIAALHENYLPSCESSTTEDSLDALSGCIDALSDSDLLQPNSRHTVSGFTSGRNGFQGAPMDNIRQEEISFHLAVRGIIFALPYPVKRKTLSTSTSTHIWSRSTGNKGDAFKMFYPTSLKIWRKVEELQTIIEAWIDKILRGHTMEARGGFATMEVKGGVVESWRSRSSTLGHELAKDTESSVLPGIGASARQEIVLVQLPYLNKILRPLRNQRLRINDLAKVVEFYGMDNQSEEAPEDDDDEPSVQTEWATDRPTELEDSPSRKRQGKPGSFQHIQTPFESLSKVTAEPGIEHLTLSDDEIIDD